VCIDTCASTIAPPARWSSGTSRSTCSSIPVSHLSERGPGSCPVFEGEAMKILFLARRNTYFRNVDSVIRDLASRGHSLLLAVDRDGAEGRPLVDALMAEFPGQIAFKELPPRSGDDW